MNEPRRVSDRLAAIFDPDTASSPIPHVAPVSICVLCRHVVTADEGTHRLIGSRWFAVHRRCPGPPVEPAA